MQDNIYEQQQQQQQIQIQITYNPMHKKKHVSSRGTSGFPGLWQGVLPWAPLATMLGIQLNLGWRKPQLPSGYVKIAIENGIYSGFTHW